MSEEVKTEEVTTEEQVQDLSSVNPFNEESWSNESVKVEEEKKEEVKTVDEVKESTVEPNLLKDNFGWDSVDAGKAEILELRKLKETKPEEIKFADEQSKQIHELIREGKTKEVRKFLETQERLESLVSAEVNKDTADDIIKMGMQLKYKDLTPKEIEYKFNKQFAIPREPVQTELETDDEFSDRKAAWKEQMSDIEMSKTIEAKLLKPELEKAKIEIVLPNISSKEGQPSKKEPTQEELDAFSKAKDSFLQLAETSIKDFNGFSVSVKDKDVDYTVSYTPSQEERTVVSDKVKEFAESGFDANSILAERWVNKEGSINVEQMVKDLSRIYSDEKASQKLVNDAASKRLEVYLKEKKRITVGSTSQGNFAPEQNGKTEMQNVQEFFWSQ